MSVESELQAEAVGHLDLTGYLIAPLDEPVAAVLRRMRETEQSCVLVTGPDGQLLGIFTARDVLHKVALHPEALSLPVQALMTPDPDTVRPEDRVAAALRFMNRGHYRHVPVVDAEGTIVGSLTHHAIVRFLSDHLPEKIYNLPPDPDLVARSPEGA